MSGTALKEWDITTGQELRSLQFANPGNTFGSAFGPGKRIYATGGDDTIVRLWDTNTGRMLKALPSSPMKIYGLAFSDDGKTLVAGGYDATLRLWDAASGAPRSVVVRSGIVSWVALHPAATSIAAGAVLDKKIRLWDAKTGALLRTLAGHTDAVKYAIFSPDGNKLASLANDKTVRIWHPATGELLRDLKGESPITFNADGSLLAVRTEGDITLLDTVTGVAVRTLRSRTEAAAKIAFSPDGKMLAYSNRGRQRTVQLWNISSGREHSTLRGEQAAVSSESVAFSPDSRSIVSGATFTTAKIWDAQSGVEKVTIGERSTTGSPTSELGNPIIYAPDGQFLISVASTGWVTLWNALTGKSLGKFSASRAEFNAIAVSPDGRSLATAGYGKGTLSQGGVALWDMGTGRIRTTLSHPGVIETVAFSPDGGKLASSGADGTIRLWNVVTGTPVRVIKASTEEIRAVAFTPDGSKLVSGGRDAMIRVFDAVTGAQLHALPTGSYGVFSLAVSTDGRLAASGDFDAGVKLWDLATGRELARVLAIDERDWLVITPDGLFDGSPGAWPLVMWRFGTNTFDVLPAGSVLQRVFSSRPARGSLGGTAAGRSTRYRRARSPAGAAQDLCAHQPVVGRGRRGDPADRCETQGRRRRSTTRAQANTPPSADPRSRPTPGQPRRRRARRDLQRSIERGTAGCQLVGDDLGVTDPGTLGPRFVDALHHELTGLATLAPARAHVLPHDDLVEVAGGDLSQLAHVLVAPVSRGRHHAHSQVRRPRGRAGVIGRRAGGHALRRSPPLRRPAALCA